ncbi:hypothetical protein [Pararhodobacter sp. SW119]|uniref:hypothetical protein n=1 Tax=Pararhodobacter sp. SW119 TaxID=2780075 RepID=UPI001AE0B628|nr:hypothetical protein [Pararhodobacter sp. SW119]
MKLGMVALVAVMTLGACASEFSMPVTGVIGRTPAQGQTTARTQGDSDFWVQTAGGLRCSGTYDAFDRSPTILAPVRCADGRTGNLVVTRTMDWSGGTAIGQLSDGTTGRFVFGNLTFEQAFGDGAGARIR